MKKMKIKEHLSLLGMKVQDRVTLFAGIVTSITFDLYGCIQALVTPRQDSEGKQSESGWYDVSRLKVLGKKPIMEVPDYDSLSISGGEKGPQKKPIPQRYKNSD